MTSDLNSKEKVYELHADMILCSLPLEIRDERTMKQRNTEGKKGKKKIRTNKQSSCTKMALLGVVPPCSLV